MVKNVFILLLCLCFRNAYGTTFYCLQISGNYTFSMGQDSKIMIKLDYKDFVIHKRDSFWVEGKFNLSRFYAFNDNFLADGLRIEIANTKGITIGNYNQGNGLYSQRCNGYAFMNPFNGANCINFGTNGAGTLCTSATMQFVKDSVYDNITPKNGHFAEQNGIYCEFNYPLQEAQLRLESPCYFNWNNNAKLQWFESNNGVDQWQPIDTGVLIYPAKSSYHGGTMFGEKRWYKVVCDSNPVKSKILEYTSKVFGPITFYLGLRMDSVVVINSKKCNEKPDVSLYWKNDSIFSQRGYPRAWVFFTPKDSANEQRWFLDTFSAHPFKINGRKLKAENGKPTPPDHLTLEKGKYKLMYDFTSWYGFNCKVYFDSFEIKDSFQSSFSPNITVISDVHCYGDSSGEVKVGVRSNDTAKIQVSYNNTTYYDTGKIFKSLTSGSHIFYIKDSRNCMVQEIVTLKNPLKFTVPIVPDTTLCNGQELFLSAFNQNATQYLWLNEDDSIGLSDTIRILQSGKYQIHWWDSNDCQAQQIIEVKREPLDVFHDFLIPSEAFISDTVYAVNTSIPRPSSYSWRFSDTGISTFATMPYTIGSVYPDTGYFQVRLSSRFKDCGYQLYKTIHIIGKSDTSKSNPKLGYKGPLIQSFSIDPNPNDGLNFTIKIQLRDTFNVSIYKLDPISGDIIGDIDLYGKKYYETHAFSDAFATGGVYYLKLIAGTESKTIKVVVAK